VKGNTYKSSPIGEGRLEEFAVVPFVHEVVFGLFVSWHDSYISEQFDTPQFYSLLHPIVSVYSYINQFLAQISTQRELRPKHDEAERALQGLGNSYGDYIAEIVEKRRKYAALLSELVNEERGSPAAASDCTQSGTAAAAATPDHGSSTRRAMSSS
jgi:hypothetical protein